MRFCSYKLRRNLFGGVGDGGYATSHFLGSLFTFPREASLTFAGLLNNVLQQLLWAGVCVCQPVNTRINHNIEVKCFLGVQQLTENLLIFFPILNFVTCSWSHEGFKYPKGNTSCPFQDIKYGQVTVEQPYSVEFPPWWI